MTIEYPLELIPKEDRKETFKYILNLLPFKTDLSDGSMSIDEENVTLTFCTNERNAQLPKSFIIVTEWKEYSNIKLRVYNKTQKEIKNMLSDNGIDFKSIQRTANIR